MYLNAKSNFLTIMISLIDFIILTGTSYKDQTERHKQTYQTEVFTKTISMYDLVIILYLKSCQRQLGILRWQMQFY